MFAAEPSKTVDRLMRTENCEVYITGSSTQMLSREVATQMRGRALSWEIFPFSFEEFLDFEGIDNRGPFSSRKRLLVQKAFAEYREVGGFPEVAALAEAMDDLNLSVATIVTRDEEETIDVASGRIRAVAAWRFILEPSTCLSPS